MSALAIKPKMTRDEFKGLVARIVEDCKTLAQQYIETWQPVDPNWSTINGAAYLRLSTDQQVSVEKGSLEQQIYIAISEAITRSNAEKVNYKITKFYIEPGITGRHDKRPEFIKLQSNIQSGKYRFVIFKELARIARETDIWKRFFRLCIEKDCAICIRSFPFNPNDPSQIFQLDIMAAFAEYESNQTSRRIKENNFSAMVHSGKFNTSRAFLGLDQLLVNGEPKVGLYTINEKEIKQVVWVMNEFLVCRSYERLLERCEKSGVTNKNGEPFTVGTLRGVLTNSRYMGKWVLNRENKEKNQDKLMPYDRYQEIELPHGQAIDSELWERVQDTVTLVAGNKTVDKATRRIYPLSGVLRFKDGSTFAGTGAWSSTSQLKHLYYWNKDHKIRIPAEIIEEKTQETVNQISANSKEMEEAIRSRILKNDEALAACTEQLENFDNQIALLEKSRGKLDTRLDFLLEGADRSEADAFKQEYRGKMAATNAEIGKLKIKREALEERITAIHDSTRNLTAYGDVAKEAQRKLAAHDPVALRSAYARLFESVVVGDEDAEGNRRLDFVLRDGSSFSSDCRVEDVSSTCLKMVGATGLEPVTSAV